MSSEMWEFDLYGDLYFEKAVNGFLAELFTKWKKEGSNHDVTIVLFSRTYYKASSVEEFPGYMRECLQEDYQGRFYEDFYRVAVQNERYDDWLPTLSHLRFTFHNYLKDVLEHHAKPGYHIPEAYNSNAAQGNFLEVLNISLNVFEKHYLDRSFDRTGQMSVVITPGVGVFEVDRELTNITKQRIIDNGVGSDLVCVGEQPLHAVPLLKFHKKRGSFKADDYSMPHTWINLSFYSSNKRAPGFGTFVPRIKVPQEILKLVSSNKPLYPMLSNMKPLVDDSLPNAMFDYDAYDAQVFKVPTNQTNRTYRSLQRTPARKKATSQSSSHNPPRVGFHRKLSDSDLYRSAENVSTSLSTGISSTVSNFLGKSPAINIPSKISENKVCSHSFGALNSEGIVEKRISANHEFEEMSSSYVSKIGSSGANSPNEFHQLVPGKQPLRPGRSLINPFDPSHVTVKLTSNRRRWIHTFPKGPTGNLIQQHHYQVSTANLSDEEDLLERLGEEDPHRIRTTSEHHSHDSFNGDEAGPTFPVKASRPRTLSTNEGWPTAGNSVCSSTASTRGTSSPQKIAAYSHGVLPPPTPVVGVHLTTTSSANNKHETLLWGATGEQEWHAEITTGVDWKSLTLPACLPLTTDYFPDKQSLHYDYEVAANYSRVPDNIDGMFFELVSQRLTQGFQLIMRPDEADIVDSVKNSLVRSRISRQEDLIKEYKLSIGRVFHKVQWKDSSIDVTVYRPKHPYAQLERRYKYLFRSPYMSSYKISCAEFRTERLENYKWNYLDNYVCFQGDPRECKLLEEFKYWRVRLMILPDLFKQETKKLMEPSNHSPCDIYHSISLDEQQTTIENFLRFMEVIHRIKRPNIGKKNRGGPSGMRERLGSNRMTERPRHFSGSKVQERLRFESGNKEEGAIRNSQNEFFEDETKEEREVKLNINMNTRELLEAMKDPINGIQCISQHSGLPRYTFVAADATFWVLRHVEEIINESGALDFLQSLLDENYIKHISGDRLKKFIHGFYLYFFITGNKEQDHVSLDITSLECDFYEVAVEPVNFSKCVNNSFATCPYFLLPDLPQDKQMWSTVNSNELTNKGMHHLGCLEIDVANKSDRYEWGHLKYQTKYSPIQCYELTLQWMCATGTVVNDLISTWQRKATHLNLHLFPVPNDPFALPFSFNSNPLRGPIVIPLNVECLKDNNSEIFSKFNANTKEQRLHFFQKSILEKFGFMGYAAENTSDVDSHFIHVSGNVMVLIANEATSIRLATRQEQEPNQKTIADGFPGSLSLHYPEPCFLWIFNYMLTKRWKSSISGDEALGERILKDFKEFCDNHNHRLRDYWDSFVTTPSDDPSLSPTSYSESDVFIL